MASIDGVHVTGRASTTDTVAGCWGMLAKICAIIPSRKKLNQTSPPPTMPRRMTAMMKRLTMERAFFAKGRTGLPELNVVSCIYLGDPEVNPPALPAPPAGSGGRKSHPSY